MPFTIGPEGPPIPIPILATREPLRKICPKSTVEWLPGTGAICSTCRRPVGRTSVDDAWEHR